MSLKGIKSIKNTMQRTLQSSNALEGSSFRLDVLNKFNQNKKKSSIRFSDKEVLFDFENQYTKNKMKDKYISQTHLINDLLNKDKGEKNSIDRLITQMAKSEFNKKDERMMLFKFIKNCLKYRLDHYLQSIDSFKNPKIRYEVLNIQKNEDAYNKKNPQNLQTIRLNEMSLKRRYKELMKEHNPLVRDNEFKVSNKVEDIYTKKKYEYLNSKAEEEREKVQKEIKDIIQTNEKIKSLAKDGNNFESYDTDNLKLSKEEETLLLIDELVKEQAFKDAKESNGGSLAEEQLATEQRIQTRDKLLLSVSKISDYPGNENGPLPSDDIDHFLTWFKVNHPDEVYKALERSIKRVEDKAQKQNLLNYEKRKSIQVNKVEEKEEEDNIHELDMDCPSLKGKEETVYDKLKRIPEKEELYDYMYLVNSDIKDQLPNCPIADEFEEYEDGDINEVWNPMSNNPFQLFNLLPPKMSFRKDEMLDTWIEWNRMNQLPEFRKFLESEEKAKDFKCDLQSDVFKINNSINATYLKKIESKSYYTLLELYPDEVKKNPIVKNIVQMCSKHPYYEFDFVHSLIDFFAASELDIHKDRKSIYLDILETHHPYPLNRKNREVLMLDPDIKKLEVKADDDYFDYFEDDDFHDDAFEALNIEITYDNEEEEREEARKLEAQEKRELEAAKESGKEAMEALKKKKEEEEKIKQEELAKQEELEYLEYLKQEEERQAREDKDQEEAMEKMMEYMSSDAAKKMVDRVWQKNAVKDPNEILGRDDKKKFIVDGGLPEINLNFINESPERMRYVELHYKATRLIITRDEENELMELLKTKDTDPELYSSITGIPLEEVLKETELKKTFTETYFQKNANIGLSELELQLAEKEISNLDSKKSENTDENNNNRDNDEEDINLDDEYFPPIPDYTRPRSIYRQNIPIDFYDNDDGFWDDIIQEKRSAFDVSNLKRRTYEDYSDMIKKKENLL